MCNNIYSTFRNAKLKRDEPIVGNRLFQAKKADFCCVSLFQVHPKV